MSTTKKKTQRWCFVPGCNTGYYNSSGEKVSLFRAPTCSVLFDKWIRAIPRADKQLDENSAVCEKHFDPRFVVRTFKHRINGEDVYMPRAVPTLTNDAVPTIFPNLPKYLTKALPKERKRRKSVAESAVSSKRISVNHDNVEEGSAIDHDVIVSEQNVMLTEQLHSLSAMLHRPSELWSMQKFEQTNALCYQTAKLDRDLTPPVIHNKIVLFEAEEGAAAQCSIFLNGFLFKKSGCQTVSQAQDLLKYADTLTPCVGIGTMEEFQPLNLESKAKLSQNRVFSLSCDGSSSISLQDGSSGRCTACRKCRNLLKARLLRLKKKKTKRPLARTAAQRLKWAVRTLKKKKMKLLTLQDALKKMREKTSQIIASVLEEKVHCPIKLL
ncbi:uncharacterized protein LOC142817930 isoform X2 [Rhipicephalus microplus]|uniref:uncharacterized protein LOC142796157 isoform X2 n=1 Tax=Rhipicephalus microplus TaxID=6941 RepID=UPI003F6D72FE